MHIFVRSKQNNMQAFNTRNKKYSDQGVEPLITYNVIAHDIRIELMPFTYTILEVVDNGGDNFFYPIGMKKQLLTETFNKNYTTLPTR